MKDNKRKYYELEIDVFALSVQDVLTASSDQNVTDDPYNPDGDDGEWWG